MRPAVPRAWGGVCSETSWSGHLEPVLPCLLGRHLCGVATSGGRHRFNPVAPKGEATASSCLASGETESQRGLHDIAVVSCSHCSVGGPLTLPGLRLGELQGHMGVQAGWEPADTAVSMSHSPAGHPPGNGPGESTKG